MSRRTEKEERLTKPRGYDHGWINPGVSGKRE